MARITVEDSLRGENNRFALVLLAAKRTKQLLAGAPVLLEEQCTNKEVVTSLREVAAGMVRFKTEEDLERDRIAAEKKREEELARQEEESIFKPRAEFDDSDGSKSEGSGNEEDSESSVGDTGVDSSSGSGSNGTNGSGPLF